MAVSYTAIETVGDNLAEKALKLYGIEADLITYLTQKSEDATTQESGVDVVVHIDRCGFDTLESFGHFEDPEAVQPILRGFADAAPKTKGSFAQLGKLRSCWNDIRKQLAAADVAPTKVEIPEVEDVDRPLERRR